MVTYDKSCTIVIEGADARIEGFVPWNVVIDATSYFSPGYQFSPRFRMHQWDGRVKLFRLSKRTFPAGLTQDVKAALEEIGIKVQVDERRQMPAFPVLSADWKKGIELEGVNFSYPYDYQPEVAEKMIQAKRGIISLATNAGKCLAPWVPVLMFDGRVLRASQLRIGDQLMGPDSKPRTITATAYGVDQMYKVTPNRCGESFECNSFHLLTILDPKTESIIDISVTEFLLWNKDRRRLSRLIRTGVVFQKHSDEVLVDPWLLGLWYADGRKDLGFVEISKPDKEIEEALGSYTKRHNMILNCQRSDNRCPSWRLITPRGQPNPLLTSIRSVFGDGSCLPARYLTGSEAERSEFLAGFIDGDGYSDGTNIELLSQHRQWAEDLAFIARSLSFGASIRRKMVRLEGWDNPREYWRILLSGNTTHLPLRLNRKHAYPKKQCNHVGFTVEPTKHGEFVGFTLKEDGRFLLGDFTVTHNTEIACLVTAALRLPTLFLVPGKELLHQTAKRFTKRLKLSENDGCGVVGDGIWKEGSWITVASVPTLFQNLSKEHTRKLLAKTQLIFIDECHRTGAESWYLTVRACNAFFRFGMSGTPLKRTDGADLRLVGATGPVIAEIRNKELIQRGISNKVNIQFIRIDKPDIDPEMPYLDTYQIGIVENYYRNRALCKKIEEFVNQKKNVIVLVKEIQHGDRIEENLWKYCKFVPHQFINGRESSEVRQTAISNFEKGELPVLIATSILDEGVDIPNIDCMVLAGGGKSSIKSLQRIGRGLRKGGSSDTLIVVDTADFQHSYLLKHSLQRLEDYKAEGCFEITVEPE